MDQWLQTPSGSGAEDAWPEEYGYSTTGENAVQDSQWDDVVTSMYGEGKDSDDEYVTASTSVFGASELRPGELMNHKIPPSWNGQGSWFAFEELVYD